MLKIEPYEETDISSLKYFVSAIQEHERRMVKDLKTGEEIGTSYANLLLQKVASQNGFILMARVDGETAGFICAWVTEDQDPLLLDDKREHGYISDIFVIEAWRGKHVAKALLQEAEIMMRQRGCKRLRVCSKSTNMQAIHFYLSTEFKPYETTFSKNLY